MYWLANYASEQPEVPNDTTTYPGCIVMAAVSILIVDDNPVNLKLATTLLQLEGYGVSTAADAEEALAARERSPGPHP